jgi:hypothetical protein
MSLSSSPRLSRRLSLAPTQAKDLRSEDEGGSMLMDISLTELAKTSPFKAKKGKVTRKQVKEDELDKLSQEELEQLAWEAMEEETRLQKRRSPRRSSGTTEESMKNVTIRQKSSTPRKGNRGNAKQSDKVAVPSVVEDVASDCFAPLPKSTSTSALKHSYDRQASPSRSALRRPYIRKSVAFGEVAEFEISTGDAQSEIDSMNTSEGADMNSIEIVASIEQSSSPLSRFGSCAAVLPTPKVIIKASKPKGRTSLRLQARVSDGGSGSVKKTTSTLSQKNPAAKTRLQEAIQNTSIKSRLKARESAVKVKAKAKVEVKAPSGFRMSSTGTLIPQPKCTPFNVAVVNPTSRGRRSIATAPSAPKANPVPAWLKRRNETLRKEEDERLEKEIERVRAQELAVGSSEDTQKTKRRTITAQPGYKSAVDKRVEERAAWEAKRKANEDILQQEKDKARKQREEREAEEYRLARQRTVIKANPVPNFIRSRAAK